MEIHKAMEAHVAWKMKFAPYLALENGALCAVSVDPVAAPPADAAPAAAAQVVALPIVTTVDDRRTHVRTSATAVLIHAQAASGRKMPLSVRPLPAGAPHAALSSLTRLKGRFSA